MIQIQINNPTGNEITVLNRKILPWEKAPKGQIVEIEAPRVAEFISVISKLNSSVTAEVVDKAPKPAPKAAKAKATKAKATEPKANKSEKAD